MMNPVKVNVVQGLTQLLSLMGEALRAKDTYTVVYLKDKRERPRCTCERCTGIPDAESYYNEDEDSVPSIESKEAENAKTPKNITNCNDT